MLKLNDSQLVILSKAINNGDIVPNSVRLESKNPSAFSRNVNTLIRKGLLEMRSGIKGVATDADYPFYDENEQARRLFVTTLANDSLEGEEEEMEDDDFGVEEEAQEEAEIEAEDADEVEGASEEISEEEDEEEKFSGSVVREGYKARYAELRAQGGTGQGCNDPIDQWMNSVFMTEFDLRTRRPRLNVQDLLAFAAQNNIDVTRWLHVNNGMKRMNIAKKVRHLIATGHDIYYGKKIVFKGAKDAKKAA